MSEKRRPDKIIVAEKQGKTLSFGSLFAGIGGLDLGFERAGFVCRWQVENHPGAQKILRRHFNSKLLTDVRECGKHNLEPVDLIAAGFPCQNISNNGLQEGIHGDKSSLFFEAMRIVREVRPTFVVLENVAALLDRGMGDVLGELAASGYDAEWDCLPAAAFGAHQIRERIFILAYPQHDWVARRWGTGSTCPKMLYSAGVCEYESSGGNFQADSALAEFSRRKAYWNGEPGVGRVAHGVSDRVDRIRGLGNAITPAQAHFLAERIIEAAGRTPSGGPNKGTA